MKKLVLYLVFILISTTAFGQNTNLGKQKADRNYIGRVQEVKSGENLKEAISSLQMGDQLVLHEGDYNGNIILENSGSEDFPIIIRGYGNGEERPVLSFKGDPKSFLNLPLLQIKGNNLIFDYLRFQSKNTYCIRIGENGKGADNITIKNSVFYECGGGDLSANYKNARYDNIFIMDNYFIGGKRTPVYIGNQQGKSPVTGFIFKGNVIDGSQNDGTETSIGYGIELKLNVTKSIVENNFFTGTKGPGVMVYGSNKPGKQNSNTVRSNIIINARQEAGIVVGGGPSVIQHNILIKNKYGIYVQNYKNRNLLDNIVINRNTLLSNRNYGISFRNIKNIIAENNVVISDRDSLGFIHNPNPDVTNKSINMSKSLDELANDVMNIIPERNNLDEIWRRVSSGPLNKDQLKKLLSLISEYKRNTKVIH